MSAKLANLYASATRGARVIKQGDVVQIVIDGGGALAAPMQDFQQAQKWANSKPATGNAISDRGRFLEQLPVLIARPGSFCATRGNDKYLEKLAKAMKAGGLDINDWSLPPSVKDLLKKPGIEDAKPKKAPDAAAPGAAEGSAATDE